MEGFCQETTNSCLLWWTNSSAAAMAALLGVALFVPQALAQGHPVGFVLCALLSAAVGVSADCNLYFSPKVSSERLTGSRCWTQWFWTTYQSWEIHVPPCTPRLWKT